MTTDAEKAAHGRQLAIAMTGHPIESKALAEELGVDRKTVNNWRAGRTMPSALQLFRLQQILGEYRTEGDPVEVAVRRSELTEDRQYDVIGYYKRRLREQAEAQTLRAVPDPYGDDLDALEDERDERPPIQGRSTGRAARKKTD